MSDSNIIKDSLAELSDNFKNCRKIWTALGDETRQHIILVMLKMPIRGTRVVEIAEKANLSRPAISHHMQILKEAGVVCSYKVRTRIYYYLSPDNESIDAIIRLCNNIKKMKAATSERGSAIPLQG